ncbi:MAG: hypothetical protein H7A45_03835 [Verrucomicrobiales bacterium]|nr:hypothetical protein [Verrucomicrobiales bacterium]
MTDAGRQRPRNRWLRALRFCRICGAFGLLLLTCAVAWLSRIGLPAPVVDLLRAEIEQRGVDATFTRIRWRPGRGLVADGVALRQAGPGGLRIRFDEVVLDLAWARLFRGDVRLSALQLSGGRLEVPLGEEAPDTGPLQVDQLSAQLRFRPDDCWEITGSQGRLLGCDLRLNGVLTNATALRRPPRSTGTNAPPARPSFWRSHLAEIRAVAGRLSLEPRPSFQVRFQGDAANPATMVVLLSLNAPRLESPWGSWERLRLAARLNETPLTNNAYHARLEVEVDRARTPWVDLDQAGFSVDLAQPATNPLPARVHWEVSAARATAPGFETGRLRIEGDSRRLDEGLQRWRHDLVADATNTVSRWLVAAGAAASLQLAFDYARSPWPEIDGAVRLRRPASPMGQADELSLSGSLRRAVTADETPPAAWGPWTNAAPWQAQVALKTAGLQSPQLALDRLELEANWSPPQLEVPHAFAQLYDGSLAVSDLRLDVGSRRLEAAVDSRFDVHRLRGVLPAKTAAWLDQFGWDSPPVARARAEVTLPPWSRSASNADPEALANSLRVQGEVTGQHASYRDVPFDAASLKVEIADGRLRLRDLHLERPEGAADLDYSLGLLSREFRWEVDCRLNPQEVAPAVDDELVRILSLFTFTNAATARGWVAGSFRPPRRTDLSLAIEATDFGFRGEPWDALSGRLDMTNRVVTATDATARSGSQWARVESLAYNTETRLLTTTNAVTLMDPMRVARAIGPEVVQVLAPYEFRQPPQIHLHGSVPASGQLESARMFFDISGGPFHFWRFTFSDVNGAVQWLGNSVVVTNFSGGFYEGRLNGDLTADVTGGATPNLKFAARVDQASLRPAIAEIFSLTNHIEGIVSGQVIVTNGNPDVLESWYGRGRFEMRDGLLWNLPVFGVVSRALNVMSPDLGNNRARAAQGTFALSRGVLQTSDLRIETGGAQLHYQGECSLTGETTARITVEVLRGTPVLGPLISIVLAPMAKAFELDVRGSLDDPQVEFRYVSKVIAPFFDPLGTLKTIFQPRPVAASPAQP